MPIAGQRIRGKATRPWFEETLEAKVVGLAVVSNMSARDYIKTEEFKKLKITLTKKEKKQAIEMWDEWRGEVAVKVRDAINRSSHIGFGSRY